MDKANEGVVPYDRAAPGMAARVAAWLNDPHAYFRAFGPEARAFQKRHRSMRLRAMTLVAPAAELAALRPVCLSVDGVAVEVASWAEAFSVTAARLIACHAETFTALQADGELVWLGASADGAPVAETLAAGALSPAFASLDEVVRRVQWLFLMCGVRLNEVVVQVDPYADDAAWAARREELRRKRREELAYMAGRRAAQRAWAEANDAPR